jgi:hypothetical protein
MSRLGGTGKSLKKGWAQRPRKPKRKKTERTLDKTYLSHSALRFLVRKVEEDSPVAARLSIILRGGKS